jgi:S-adenosylmethionine hydrolase
MFNRKWFNSHRKHSVFALFVLLLTSYSGATSDQKSSSSSALTGEVVSIEAPYGNLVTNISAYKLLGLGYHYGDQVSVSIGGKSYTLPFARNYSDVPKNKPLIVANVKSTLTIAVNMGSAQSFFGANSSTPVIIQKK